MNTNTNLITSDIDSDPSGFGSIQDTWKDAHNKNATINYNDVKEWLNNNIKQKTNQKGKNSCVAQHAYKEFSHSYFTTRLTCQEYTIGMICIDMISKHTVLYII